MKSATAILPHPKEGHEDCTAKHKGADSGPYAMQLKNAFIGGIREEICDHKLHTCQPARILCTNYAILGQNTQVQNAS